MSANASNLVPFQFKPGFDPRRLLSPRKRAYINEKFLTALAKDFDEHGKKAIAACREEHPDRYVAILAALVPRDEPEQPQRLSDISDDELYAAIEFFRQRLALESGADSGGAPATIEAQPLPAVPETG